MSGDDVWGNQILLIANALLAHLGSLLLKLSYSKNQQVQVLVEYLTVESQVEIVD